MTGRCRAFVAMVLAVLLASAGCSATRTDYLDPQVLESEVTRLAKLVGSTEIVSITASHELLMVRFAKDGQQVEARAWNNEVLAPSVRNPLDTPLSLADLDLRHIGGTVIHSTNECTDPELVIQAAGPAQGYFKLTCQTGVRQVWWVADTKPIAINLNTVGGITDALARASIGMDQVAKVSIGSGRGNELTVVSPGLQWGTRITVKDGRIPVISNFGHDGPTFRVADLDPQRIYDCAARLMIMGGYITWFVDIYARADGQILLSFDMPGGWYPSGEGTALNQDCQEIPR